MVEGPKTYKIWAKNERTEWEREREANHKITSRDRKLKNFRLFSNRYILFSFTHTLLCGWKCTVSTAAITICPVTVRNLGMRERYDTESEERIKKHRHHHAQNNNVKWTTKLRPWKWKWYAMRCVQSQMIAYDHSKTKLLVRIDEIIQPKFVAFFLLRFVIFHIRTQNKKCGWEWETTHQFFCDAKKLWIFFQMQLIAILWAFFNAVVFFFDFCVIQSQTWLSKWMW